MGLTTHIRNLIFLWRQRNKIEIPKNVNPEVILSITKNKYKKKNSWVRNQVALLIRKIRKEKPYKIKDYSKARELYNSRTPIDLSKVKEGSYVYKISREEPVKGKRWCEYYINEYGTEGTYRVYKKENYLDYEYFSLEKYNGDWNHFVTLDEKSSRSFRFATKEEIQEFKNHQKEYKAKRNS